MKSTKFIRNCKKLKIRICLAIYFTGAIFSCSNKHDTSIISFQKATTDFGQISINRDTIISFEFSNLGGQPISISKVVADCGCTVPKWTDDKIMPKQKGKILVKINPFSVGKFDSSVNVYFDGEPLPKILRIKGNIEYLSLIQD